MNLKIISWNVRGLHDPAKRAGIRHLLQTWKVDLVCLQETKLVAVTELVVCSLWRSRSKGWTFLPSIGAAGGILLL